MATKDTYDIIVWVKDNPIGYCFTGKPKSLAEDVVKCVRDSVGFILKEGDTMMSFAPGTTTYVKTAVFKES